MSQCESKMTRKAWRNPLAPMAQCSRDATMVVENPGLGWAKPTSVCGMHGNRLLARGWTKAAAPATTAKEGT